MKAIILKGDNDLAIQKRYLEIKKENKLKSVRTVMVDTSNAGDMADISTKDTLFEESSKAVIIGNINKKSVAKYFEIEKEEEYKLPKTIYKFLDSFYPGNYINSKRYLLTLVDEEPIEMIFATLAKYLRDLLWVKMAPDTLNYESWRMGKLKQYSNKYTLIELKTLIKKLAEIDISVKTSKNNLINLLDLMILSRLE